MNTFLDYWNAGYRRLTPITPPGARVSERSTLFRRPGALGKVPGVRGRDGTWHSFQWTTHEPDERDLLRWQNMEAGIGIKTGRQDDGTWLVGIDADTLNATWATLIRIQVSDTFGLVPCRVGRAPKALYIVRLDGELTYRRINFNDETGKDARVEILSEGRQFVAAGTHPETRAPYTWTVPLVPFAELPIVSASEFA